MTEIVSDEKIVEGFAKLLLYAVAFFIVGIVGLLVLLILPLLISLIGFAFDVSQRLWMGICSILATIYLLLDYHFKLIAYITIFGNKNPDSWYGWLENGIFGGKLQEIVHYIYVVDSIGVLIAIFFIIWSMNHNN